MTFFLFKFAGQPEQSGKYDTNQDTSGDWKIEIEIITPNDNIAGKFTETKLCQVGPQQADDYQPHSQRD
jgi:hypothetical protein